MGRKRNFDLLHNYICALKMQGHTIDDVCDEVCKTYEVNLETKRERKKLKRYINNSPQNFSHQI